MFRLIIPIILIIGSIAGFSVMVNPAYKESKALQAQIDSYDQALANSRSLENERDKLTQRFNSMSSNDINRLQKLLPDSVDNIRLILEIEKLASPYGMALKDVRYDAKAEDAKKNSDAGTGASSAAQGGQGKNTNKEYGSWDLEFTVDGSYNDFLNFLQDLEHNLRIVDVVSVKFSSVNSLPGKSNNLSITAADVYRYTFRVKTYWLKN